MKSKNRACLEKVVVTTALCAAAAAVAFQCAGCGKMNALKRNQLKLQKMVQSGNQQIAGNMATIEKRQIVLQNGFEASSSQMANSMAAVRQTQGVLRDEMRIQIEQMMGSIAAMQDAQVQLHTGIENNTERLSVNTSNLTANLTAVQDNVVRTRQMLANLQKTQVQSQKGIENNTERLSANMANLSKVEGNVLKVQRMLAALQKHSGQVANRVALIGEKQADMGQSQGAAATGIQQILSNFEALGESLAELHEMLAAVQDNSEKTTTKLAEIRRNQLELRGSIEDNIRQIAENAEAIEQLNPSVLPSESLEAVPAENPIATTAKAAESDE